MKTITNFNDFCRFTKCKSTLIKDILEGKIAYGIGEVFIADKNKNLKPLGENINSELEIIIDIISDDKIVVVYREEIGEFLADGIAPYFLQCNEKTLKLLPSILIKKIIDIKTEVESTANLRKKQKLIKILEDEKLKSGDIEKIFE